MGNTQQTFCFTPRQRDDNLHTDIIKTQKMEIGTSLKDARAQKVKVFSPRHIRTPSYERSFVTIPEKTVFSPKNATDFDKIFPRLK